MATVYENYERIRDEKGLKNIDVSKMSGVSTSTLSEWKNGLYEPKLSTLRKVAVVLNCTIDDLIDEN